MWCYLFEEVGVPLVCHDGARVSWADAAALLPGARRYRPLAELGDDFFRLQCYFLTHFLYVASDWGAHALRAELYAEELAFLLENLSVVVRLDDPELVGEFVQCLGILRVAGARDGDDDDRDDGGGGGAAAAAARARAAPYVERAVAYLVERERKLGGRGAWVPKTQSLYTW